MKRTPLQRKAWFRATEPPPRAAIPAQRKPLRTVSTKRRKENQVRRHVVQAITGGERPTCFVRGCGRPADDAHELLSRARGGSITDPRNIAFPCRTHHQLITTRPAWAEAEGYALPSPRRRHD